MSSSKDNAELELDDGSRGGPREESVGKGSEEQDYYTNNTEYFIPYLGSYTHLHQEGLWCLSCLDKDTDTNADTYTDTDADTDSDTATDRHRHRHRHRDRHIHGHRHRHRH